MKKNIVRLLLLEVNRKSIMTFTRFLTIFFFLSLCSTNFAYAQKEPTRVSGNIEDALTRESIKPLDSVKVDLLRVDSTYVLSFKISGNKTRTTFWADVPQQDENTFLLRLISPGYQTTYKSLKLVWRRQKANMYLGALTMRRRPITNRSHALGEATVQATKIKFYTKNDTLIYNADAFQLQEGSMLEARRAHHGTRPFRGKPSA